MIISNIARNAQTISGWCRSKKRGSGHRNNKELYDAMFPFNVDAFNPASGQFIGITESDFVSALQRKGLPVIDDPSRRVQYIRWFWMLNQKFRRELIPVNRSKWSDDSVPETTLLLSTRYVNCSALIYDYGPDGASAYLNSIVLNPYIAGGGLGSIAYKRLQNYLFTKHKVNKIFLMPLMQSDGADTDMTPYWQKMGFDWPRGKKEVLELTDREGRFGEDAERYTSPIPGRPATYINGTNWYPTFMMKKITSEYPLEQLQTANIDFNYEVDFYECKIDPPPVSESFFKYTPDDETKMTLISRELPPIVQLEASVSLAVPANLIPKAQPRSGRVKRKRDVPDEPAKAPRNVVLKMNTGFNEKAIKNPKQPTEPPVPVTKSKNPDPDVEYIGTFPPKVVDVVSP